MFLSCVRYVDRGRREALTSLCLLMLHQRSGASVGNGVLGCVGLVQQQQSGSGLRRRRMKRTVILVQSRCVSLLPQRFSFFILSSHTYLPTGNSTRSGGAWLER